MDTYTYRIKNKANRDSIKLTSHARSIRQAVHSVFGNDVPLTISDACFTFELDTAATRIELRRMGQLISYHDSFLRSKVIEYATSRHLFMRVN